MILDWLLNRAEHGLDWVGQAPLGASAVFQSTVILPPTVNLLGPGPTSIRISKTFLLRWLVCATMPTLLVVIISYLASVFLSDQKLAGYYAIPDFTFPEFVVCFVVGIPCTIAFHEAVHASRVRKLGGIPEMSGCPVRPYCVASNLYINRKDYEYYSLGPLWIVSLVLFVLLLLLIVGTLVRHWTAYWFPASVILCLHSIYCYQDGWFTRCVRQNTSVSYINVRIDKATGVLSSSFYG